MEGFTSIFNFILLFLHVLNRFHCLFNLKNSYLMRVILIKRFFSMLFKIRMCHNNSLMSTFQGFFGFLYSFNCKIFRHFILGFKFSHVFCFLNPFFSFYKCLFSHELVLLLCSYITIFFCFRISNLRNLSKMHVISNSFDLLLCQLFRNNSSFSFWNYYL